MAFKPFVKVRIQSDAVPTSKDVNDVQDSISNAINQLLGKDELDLHLIKNQVLLPGIINKISHGLGRRLNGWFVVRNHGGYSIITDEQDNNSSQHLLLYLTTPAQCKVDLLVF